MIERRDGLTTLLATFLLSTIIFFSSPVSSSDSPSASAQLHAGYQLNENNFESETKAGLWFIECYSPFCPHCKRFASKWIELVDNEKPLEAKHLKLGQVDCIAQGDLCVKMNVDYYPQMKLYEDGKFVENYKGDKDPAVIQEYLKLKLEAYNANHPDPDLTDHTPPQHSSSPHAASSTTQSSSHNSVPPPNVDGTVVSLDSQNWAKYTHVHHNAHPTLVKFYTAWCKECRQLIPAYLETAKLLRGIAFVGEFDCDAPWNRQMCDKQGVSEYPSYILYHDDTKIIHTGGKKPSDLVEFVEKVAFTPGTHEVTVPELDAAIETQDVVFLFLHSSDTPASVMSAVSTVGKSLTGSAKILKSDLPEVFEKFSLSRDWPYLMVFKASDPTPWAKTGLGEPHSKSYGDKPHQQIPFMAHQIRHWMASNSVPLMEELNHINFNRIMSSGYQKQVVLACLSGMVSSDAGLDIEKSNPKSVKLMHDMKNWAHQWRKSQEARDVDYITIDWVWVNADNWGNWLYSAYGVNLPKPADDPRDSSAIIIVNAYTHHFYDTQANGQDIKFRPSSIFQTLLAIEMNQISGRLSGTLAGRIRWRIHQFIESIKFMFKPQWLLFWAVLVGVIAVSVKAYRQSTSQGGYHSLSSPSGSKPLGGGSLHHANSFSGLNGNACKTGFGQVFGLNSNVPSLKAD